MEPLVLATEGPASRLSAPLNVQVHPVCLLSILDQHIRRLPQQDRAIGVLLGTVNGGVVEVTNSFGVRHFFQNNQVLVKRAAVSAHLDLHHRVNDQEVVVGWYSTITSTEILDEISVVLHEFFGEFCLRPIHLVVDTRMQTDSMGIHAFVASTNSVLKRVLVPFQQIKVSVVASAEERVGIDAMMRTSSITGRPDSDGTRVSRGEHGEDEIADSTKVVSDVEALESSIRRFKTLIDTALSYVDHVLAGNPGDEAAGRALLDLLSSLPAISPDNTGRVFGVNVQDTLMTTYLASLTQAQMKLVEKMTTTVPTRR